MQLGFRTDPKSANGSTDMRTKYKDYGNYSSSINNSGLPSAADANKYFYLPALGRYLFGRLYSVGIYGYYWSSSARPSGSGNAYTMGFGIGGIAVNSSSRSWGLRVGGFE